VTLRRLLSALLLPGALSFGAACGGGVFRNPLDAGPRAGDDGGPPDTSATDAGAPADTASDAPADGSRPRLGGDWTACGQMGTGGPGQVALSADGSLLAILFVQGQLAVHRVADQAKLLELANVVAPPPPGPDPNVAPSPSYTFLEDHALALAPNGSSVLAQDANHIAAWKIPSGERLFDVAGNFDSPMIDPTGRTFVVRHRNLVRDGGAVTVVELRGVSDGSLIHEYDVGGVVSIGFGNGGSQVLMLRPVFAVCDSQCPEIRAYNSDFAGTLAAVVPLAQADPFSTGTFSPTGRYLAGFQIGAPDQLDVVDTTDGHRVLLASASGDGAVFAPDETALLTFSQTRADVQSQIVDLATGQVTPVGRTDVAWGALGPGARPAFALDASGVYWAKDPRAQPGPPEASQFTRFPTLPGQGRSFMAATVSPDGRWLATASAGGAAAGVDDVIVWDLPGQRGQRALMGLSASTVAFSPDGKRLLLAGPPEDSALREWPLDADAPDWTIAPQNNAIWKALYGPDGKQAVVALGDGIGVMNTGDTTVGATIAVGEQGLAAALVPGAGRLVVSGPELWQLSDGRKIWPSGAAGPRVFQNAADNWVVFSPDGSLLLTSDFQSTAPPPWNSIPDPNLRDRDNYTTRTQVFTTDGASLTLRYDIGAGLPRRPVFSPDGAWILAGNVLWSLESQGSKTLPLSRGYLQVSVSTMAPDGTIAIGREDGVIELYCPK
jgi:hypothetical protein